MREIRNTKIIAVDHGYGNISSRTSLDVPTHAWRKLPIQSHLPESPLMKQSQSLPETFLNTTEPITVSAKGTKNLSRIRLWMKIIIS